MIIPSYYIAETEVSDATHCSSVTVAKSILIATNCSQPSTSVLFDYDISSDISGLDNTSGASGLLTLYSNTHGKTLDFDFTQTPGYSGIRRIEVVMFNCRQRGTATLSIQVLGAESQSSFHRLLKLIAFTDPNSEIITCDSLVRICISHSTTLPVLIIQFNTLDRTDRVHVAEVTFYVNSSICPPDDAIATLGPRNATPPSIPHTSSKPIYCKGTDFRGLWFGEFCCTFKGVKIHENY